MNYEELARQDIDPEISAQRKKEENRISMSEITIYEVVNLLIVLGSAHLTARCSP